VSRKSNTGVPDIPIEYAQVHRDEILLSFNPPKIGNIYVPANEKSVPYGWCKVMKTGKNCTLEAGDYVYISNNVVPHPLEVSGLRYYIMQERQIAISCTKKEYERFISENKITEEQSA
jgi:hypothetical protein